MNRRRGFSLIEMLVVISITSVMLGIAVTLLYGLMRMDLAGREHAHYGSVLARLADQFRQDVHAAHTVTALADGEGWQFTPAPGRTVTYRPEPGGLARIERADGTIQHQESYALPRGSTPSIEVPGDAEPPLVALVVTPATDATDQPAGPGKQIVRIEAVLARDHRFTTAGGVQ